MSSFISLFKNIDLHTYWQQKQQSWLKRRLPYQRSIHLGQKNLFIFLTRYGIGYLFLLMIIFLAGINYANSLILLGCFILLGILLISVGVTFLQLADLTIEAISISDTHVNAETQLVLKLSKKIRRQVSQLILSSDQHQLVIPVFKKGSSHIEVALPISFNQRQKTTPPRLRLCSTYPFGLMRVWSYCHFDLPIWISPQPLAIPSIAINASGLKQTASRQKATQNHTLGGMDDLHQLLPYIKGQSLAQVSWPHVAKGVGYLTKSFSGDEAPNTFELRYDQMPAIDHETKLSQMAWLVIQMSEKNHRFSVVLPNVTLTADSGANHQQQILRALAEHQ